jgi:GxxExxY protein
MKEEALTEELIGIFYTVYNDLGHGFLESIYRKAFALQLTRKGIYFEQQKEMHIRYLGVDLGQFFADLVVQSSVIVELKAVAAIEKAYERQLLNYLRASDLEVGLVLNFGPKPQIRRMIFDNEKKLEQRSTSAGQA